MLCEENLKIEKTREEIMEFFSLRCFKGKLYTVKQKCKGTFISHGNFQADKLHSKNIRDTP